MRLGPLRGRDYRLLFVARTTSRFGGAMAPVALAFAVLTTLNGSATDLGIVLAARIVPTVIFILLGGVLGDRLPRNVVMVGSNTISGASQAAAAALLLTGHGSVAALAVLAAANGLSSAFFMPASEGIVPQLVDAALPPGGERPPAPLAERDQHLRRGDRRHRRRGVEPGLGDRSRRALVLPRRGGDGGDATAAHARRLAVRAQRSAASS